MKTLRAFGVGTKVLAGLLALYAAATAVGFLVIPILT